MNWRLAVLLTLLNNRITLDNSSYHRLFSVEFDEGDPESVNWALREEVTSLQERSREWWIPALKMINQSRDHDVQWSYPSKEDYPSSWLELSNYPKVFAYKGNPIWRHKSLLAVVGSRTPKSDTIRWLNNELSRWIELSHQEPKGAVVSGGARGVDQLAHRICLAKSRPTLVVLPTGVLNPYPTLRDDLWSEIIETGGCLLSPFGLDVPLYKSAFAIRNRWIAGLAEVTLIAEANRRSGSAMTASLAFQEGKFVATLPTSPMASQGMANLDIIYSGGVMLRDAVDLFALTQRAKCRLSPGLF